jgi:hypothetical protein
MPQAFYILFGAALAVALGRLLFLRLSLQFYRGEEYLLAFVPGAACLSVLVFAITALGLAYKGVFLAIGVLTAVVFARKTTQGPMRAPLPRFWKLLFAGVFAVFACLYFFNAMAPEISPDGSAYHLGLVSRYLHERGFHRITTNIYASMPQGVEMLFLFAFAFGRHSSAALVHFAFLVFLALAMLSYGRRIGRPGAGAAGALFVFCSPIFGIDGTSAYNDVAVACILFTLFYLLEIWDEERTPALLFPIGLVAGFAYAAKYTAFLAVPYALGYVAWKTRKLRPTLVVAGCALAMMLPWMAKNWLWVENPFSPFLNQLFPNPYVHIAFEQEYAHEMRHYEGIASYWAIPKQVTVDGRALGGILGPLFLLAPFALLALRERKGRRLLLAAAVFSLPYSANIGTRFLIPAAPFVALAMALVFAQWRALAAVMVVAHALASWPAVVAEYAPRAWRLTEVPVRAALRIEHEEDYLIRKMPPYITARTIESFVPPGKRVFAPSPTADAYTGREVLVSYQGAFNEMLGYMLSAPWVPEYQPTRRLRFHFAPEALRKVRVVQTASDDSEKWSIAEFRLFRGGQQLRVNPQWRFQAKPFPWDVRMAFDGNPITRWCSWQSIFPGMYVEAGFGSPEAVDSVELDCSRDQYRTRLRLEGEIVTGAWKTLADAPAESEIPPPADLRRATARAMKAMGIDYILMGPSDFGANDLRDHPEAWGVTEVAERSGTRLYRID